MVQLTDLNGSEFPASIGQRLLSLMERYRGANGALNCPVLLQLRGPVDVGVLRSAVDGLIRRHEALRTTFTGRGPKLRQAIQAPRAADFAEITVDGPAAPGALQKMLLEELRRPIDIADNPLRARLFKTGSTEYVFCLNVHHMATDAWSNGIISRELGREYERILRGSGPLPAPASQYRQFVSWQNDDLSGDRLQRLQGHWRGKLQGVTFPDLPGKPGSERSRVGAYQRASLPTASVTRLDKLCRSYRATLFAAMLTVYFVVMQRYTSQRDQAVVSIFANRSRAEFLGTVGFLANPLVLRTSVPPEESFVQLLARVRSTVLDAFIHQALPYQMLPLRSADTGSALDVVFQMFAEPVHQTKIAGLDVGLFPMPDGWGVRFDLDFSVIPEGDGMAVLAGYSVDRFEAHWVRRMLHDFERLVCAVAEHPDTPVTEVW